MTDPIKTLVIDNFQGSMTINQYGDINSGRSFMLNSAAQNPFVKPKQLTWSETPVQIDSAGSVITDLIMAAKTRVESGITYVYAIGHLGRLYKIQVNDPTTFNPNYDNPVLLATLAVNTPTFTRGGFIDFYGATSRIYIGHDKGMTQINFDGTGESFVGVLGSWTQNVPRPLKQFLGKLYIGNGSNIAEMDTTLTITSYGKLSPGFPADSQVRDLDLSVDGNYLEVVANTSALPDITITTQETALVSPSSSFIFRWNGIDVGYTAQNTFPSLSLGANTLFQDFQYTFGYEQSGYSVFNPTKKVLNMPEAQAPMPNAVFSISNMLCYISPLYYLGVLEADIFMWGSMDFETGNPLGFWTPFFVNATAPETDIVRVPVCLPVSNFAIGASNNGFADNVFSETKMYFSTLETSASTTKYRFYRWTLIGSPSQPVDTAINLGYYQTQTQMFSKKVKINEVRIYGEPWVANNSFTVDIIGSAGTAISGGSKTFTAGTNLTIGDDFAWYTPQCAPTYAVGLAITNLGSANHTINKIEIDYSAGGK